MNRRDFIKAGLVGAAVLALPGLTKATPYPPNIAQYITPDFEYVKKYRRIRDGIAPSDVYVFWHTGINHRLHIGYLPNGDLVAQWWCKGALWYPRKGYYCRRHNPRFMNRFIQSYIKEHPHDG